MDCFSWSWRQHLWSNVSSTTSFSFKKHALATTYITTPLWHHDTFASGFWLDILFKSFAREWPWEMQEASLLVQYPVLHEQHWRKCNGHKTHKLVCSLRQGVVCLLAWWAMMIIMISEPYLVCCKCKITKKKAELQVGVEPDMFFHMLMEV